MAEFVDAYPTARKRHRCGVCFWWIEPGETYWRQAGFDEGTAYTHKTCAWCERVVYAYGRFTGEHDWDMEVMREWLGEEFPVVDAQLCAGWRYPDGERVPYPFSSTCIECHTPVEFRTLWCAECDRARIDRIGKQLASIRDLLDSPKL